MDMSSRAIALRPVGVHDIADGSGHDVIGDVGVDRGFLLPGQLPGATGRKHR